MRAWGVNGCGTSLSSGDAVNYGVGCHIRGGDVEAHPEIFKKEHLEKTRRLFQRFGGKAVVLARFLVVARTFAPFVAGVAGMRYAKFLAFNVVGGGIWVSSFMCLGYLFAQIPAVRAGVVPRRGVHSHHN